MYKIYINDKPVVIAESSNMPESAESYHTINSESANLVFNNQVADPAVKGWKIVTDHPEEGFSRLISQFRLIEAAGGLVRNASGEYLFIFRRNKWDLPKGKIDKGENEEEAAIREVREECGIAHIKLLSHLTDTWHLYSEKGEHILKRTYWYAMSSNDAELTPQTEEDITAVEWLRTDQLGKVRANTYGSILDVMDFIK